MTTLGATIPFYRRLPSPLHAARAWVTTAWTVALLLAALLSYSPVVLFALLLGVLGAAAGAGVLDQVLRSLRAAMIVAVPIVVVNVIVSRGGLTVFARIGDLGPFGRGNLTVEALAYGGIIALKLTLVILIVVLATLAVDPDELLRVVRRLSFRSALTAAIAMRMLPLLASDAQRIAEAQRTRPHAPESRTRSRLAIVAAVVGGALDRAMDVAATLEVRGFASPQRPARAARVAHAPSRHDIAFAASALTIAALAIAAHAADAASFDAYPTIHIALGAATPLIAVAFSAAMLLPFASRRGIDA
jgi:energy-coupling factor transport system permease protein